MTIEEIKKYKIQYIKKLESDRKSSLTIDSYSYNLDKMIDYIEGNNDVNFNIKVAIFDYIDSMDSAYKPTTINTRRSPVRGFIGFMKDRDYIKENFSGGIGVVKEDKPPRDVLEPKEIESILTILSKELKEAEGYEVYFKIRNLTLFSFLLYTGVRRSESVMCKWSNIDFINNEIRVLGKGNKTRLIPLLPDLKQQLYMFKDVLEQMYNVGYDVKSDYLFRSEKRNKQTKEKNSPMTTRNVAIIIKDICSKANITKQISPHVIRHTFASYGVKNKVSHISMAETLGHSNLSTFLNIYTHEISMEEKKKEIGKIRFDI